MIARLSRLPLLLVLMGIGALAMFVPAIHAYQVRELHIARSFFYSGCLFGVLFVLLAIALSSHRTSRPTRSHLVALVGALILLPLMLAIPFREAVGDVRLFNSWFEMVSSLTTTGATVYPGEGRLPETLHLWRALVAWLGGLLFWVSAVAILAPLNLGGFEVAAADRAITRRKVLRDGPASDTADRLVRYTFQLTPIYAGLTLALWAGLAATGMRPFEGAVFALSTLSTSGITPGTGAAPGVMAELVIFPFLFFAVSRLTFSTDNTARKRGYLLRDPEIRLALTLLLLVPGFLFLRHWIGAFEISEEEDLGAAFRALWGATFTTLSFLTTTGFESAAFNDARNWSGLPTTGLLLMGLSLVGGGVATTAGGVKLLRIYALYKHGTREMERLVHPSSIGGSGEAARRLRRQGAFVAWIFFMLFAISISVFMAALSLAGLDFETATILSIAALSTTGPLAGSAGDQPILYSELGDAGRAILGVAMVVGRLETLALIALFNRDFWRR